MRKRTFRGDTLRYGAIVGLWRDAIGTLMRDACAADDPWQGYHQKCRVFFRKARLSTALAPGRQTLVLYRSILVPRPWTGLGLERIAAFIALVIRTPVNVLTQLLQQGDVLRAVNVRLFYLDK